MPKSFLKTLIVRASKLAQASYHRQRPIEDCLASSLAAAQPLKSQKAPSVNRRHLLRAGLVVGGAIAAQGLNQAFAPEPASANGAKILIVGAGIAGLTAAYRLKQAGIAVDIVEARDRVGGRMRTLENAFGSGIGAELGGEFIDTGHTRIRGLAAELGLTLQDLQITDGGLGDSFYFQGRLLSIADVAREFVPLIPSLERDFAIAEDLTSPAAIALDRLSISEYLARQPISPLLRNLLESAYTYEYGLDAAVQSSLNLITLIGQNPDRFEVYGESDERFHIIGGNAQVPRRLAQRLESSLIMGTALERIRLLSDGRYRVSLRSAWRTSERTYDRVLLAIPFTVLRRIELALPLPPGKRRAIDQLGYGTNSKVIAPYSTPIWKTRYGSTGSVFTDFQVQGWEATRYAPGRTRLYTHFTGGKDGRSVGAETPEFQVRRVLPKFDRIFPGIQAAYQGGGVRAYWTGEAYSRGSYSCYRVGQWTSISGEEIKRVGNLFFAGEHCSEVAQGYMEGGCETGEAAALQILADLKIPSPQTKRRRSRRKRTQ
jgi:monoamine oxidase